MITIKEIKIPTPKWWQTGLIIIAVVVAIIVAKEDPKEILEFIKLLF